MNDSIAFGQVEFKLIAGEYGPYSFEAEVNSWLQQGWRLHGDMHFEQPNLHHTQGVFYQALILENKQ